MGRDKHENEDLIKWGWPEDVWFHVDKVSSAHVYLRLAPGQSLDTVRNLIHMHYLKHLLLSLTFSIISALQRRHHRLRPTSQGKQYHGEQDE